MNNYSAIEYNGSLFSQMYLLLYTGLLGAGDSEETKEKNVISGSMMPLGGIIISKEATLEELKLQIMTLPQFTSICCVPSHSFMRLSLLENKKCTSVLRGHELTVQ